MTIKKQVYLLYRMIRPIFDPFQFIKSITGYGQYLLEIRNYSKMQGAERIKIIDLYPCLGENIATSSFDDSTVDSLSCLHVAEHIGLGRYGDPLNTHGTEQAAKELSRVLAVGGNLFFAVPVGKPRLCFNAHRIHSPNQIIQYFSNLELVEFSGVDDEGKYRRNIPVSELENCIYGCGFFWFKKLQDFSGRTSKVSNR
jgi:hypothetical protein